MATNSLWPSGRLLKCRTPLAPLRKEPGEGSELETQVLYGQACELIEIGEKDWIRIKILADQYSGWSDIKHFFDDSESGGVISGDLISRISTKWGDQLVPFGSVLTEEEARQVKVKGPNSNPSAENIILCASGWENAPYLWGGKSILGVDCSAFVQLIFSFFDIQLPRNASQQATEGREIHYGDHRKGDLAFFSNDANRVIHVGLLADYDIIWHASGMVRLDNFTQAGIIHKTLNKLTHKLHSIRRIIGEWP